MKPSQLFEQTKNVMSQTTRFGVGEEGFRVKHLNPCPSPKENSALYMFFLKKVLYYMLYD
jgi:hypothetical protein